MGRRKKERRESYSLHKEPIVDRASPDFWRTLLSRAQRGYQKSWPDGDHYYVGCLSQTHVSLPE